MSKQLCPECGKSLPTGSPAGMCPNCLLSLGLAAAAFTPELSGRLASPAAPGDHIGRYKLLELIGEGGFGNVWMAEQQEPVRRKVALKILKLGMDTREVVARFEAERQALAMMDHANIAKVLDAGATEHGRPFFVMELVAGVPITTFCDTHRLNTRERIELFVLVCEAVQHAHQKGVIHRDLKPGNILVGEQDGRFVPKVIDFGVAKALEEPLTDKTLFTRYQQFLGTPTYMSPEQAGLGGLDIDTRSDIYSLGVLLYELLTGRTPFTNEQLRKVQLDEVLRVIREQEPPKPSTRLTQDLAAEDLRRRTSPQPDESASSRQRLQQLIRLLRGELDWIILKALDKDRARRYATANGFATDLRRYLEGEAVTAAPPTVGYRLSKLARKHRFAIATSGAFAALLFAGIVATTWQAIRATHLARAESQQRAQAEAGEASAQQSLYAAEMHVAQQAYLDHNLGRAAELLEKHAPKNPLSQSASAFWEWRYLWSKTRSDQVFQLGPHDHAVTSVDFSSDGRLAMTGCADHLVRLWEFPSRRLAATFTNLHTVRAVAHSHHESWIALGGHGTEITIWDPVRNRILHSLTNQGMVLALALSGDDRLLAAGNFKFVNLWDTATGQLVRQIPIKHTWWLPTGLAFSPDSTALAYHTGQGAGAIMDLRSGLSRTLPSPHTRDALAMVFSPDGKLLITGSYDGSVKVRDSVSGEVQKAWTNSIGFVAALAISPNGRVLATAGADQRIRLYETGSWRELAVLKGHRHEIWSVAFSPDGEHLLSGGSSDETARVWKTDTRSKALPNVALPGSPALVVPASDGSKILFCYTNGTWNTLDCASLQTSETRPLRVGSNHQAAALDPQGRHIAVADGDGAIWLLDATGGMAAIPLAAAGPKVRMLGFSADGRSIACLRNLQSIEVWSIQGKRTFELKNPPEKNYPEMRAFALSRDGRTLVIGFITGEVSVYDLATQERTAHFREHRWTITDVAISPDGRTVASAGAEGKIKLYDLQNGTVRATLSGLLSDCGALAFSRNGERLAGGGIGGNVVIWDVTATEPRELARLRDAKLNTTTVQFADDGNALIALGMSRGRIQELLIWQAAPWAEIAARPGF